MLRGLRKTFDQVNWVKMMEILRNIGEDWRDRKLMWNLYQGQVAYVRIGDGLSSACSIGRGVRQGCSILPLQYLLYDEAVIREAITMQTLAYQWEVEWSTPLAMQPLTTHG